MPKFKAPKHETAISTFAGERRVDKNGIINVEANAHAAEIAAIRAAGWTEIFDDAPESKVPSAPKKRAARRSKAAAKAPAEA